MAVDELFGFKDTLESDLHGSIGVNKGGLTELHVLITGSTTSFWRSPNDDLVRVHYGTGLAVHAVGEIKLQVWFSILLDHFIDTRRTKVLAGISILIRTTFVADVKIQNLEVARLIFFVSRVRKVNVGEFIEGKLSIEGYLPEFGVNTTRIILQLLHKGVTRNYWERILDTPTPAQKLQASMEYSPPPTLLESLTKVAYPP